LMFSFKFSHFLNLRACKNDNFLFIMETSRLEARNIWFVSSNLSRVQESGLNILCKMSEIHEIGGVRHQI
jgi:hypothetical protein